MTRFGEHIKKRRIELGLTQKALLELLDISPQFLSDIENGSRCPKLERVSEYASALDVSPDYLCYLLGYFPEAERSGERMGPDEFAERMKQFRKVGNG